MTRPTSRPSSAASATRSQPLDIVLVRTGRDAFYGELDYIARGPGVTADATRWLYEQGVRVMGIDAWGWDRPLHLQAQEALERGEPGIFWAAHQADLPYSQIERLTNLGALPSAGFRSAASPCASSAQRGARRASSPSSTTDAQLAARTLTEPRAVFL